MTGALTPVPVDERDTVWEHNLADFRVIVLEDNTTVAYDLTAARCSDVLDWAAGRAAGAASYAVALRTTDEQGRPGLFWLTDPPEGL